MNNSKQTDKYYVFPDITNLKNTYYSIFENFPSELTYGASYSEIQKTVDKLKQEILTDLVPFYSIFDSFYPEEVRESDIFIDFNKKTIVVIDGGEYELLHYTGKTINHDKKYRFKFFTTKDNYDLLKKKLEPLFIRQIITDGISFLEKDADGFLRLVEHKMEKFELNISENYNDDFIAIDKRIHDWIDDTQSINKKLILLSGDPGTGKTNYIKNLLSNINSRKVIYIPPFQISALSDPGFFSFISDYKKSVIIIEDAEKILLSRKHNIESADVVSLILNMTDGMLASVLDFRVICTFNSDEDLIDPALLRKGRLFLKYNFQKLSKEKTNNLYQKLYKKLPPFDTMTLADIYEDADNYARKEETRIIGFGT